jgi:hypothetical protein
MMKNTKTQTNDCQPLFESERAEDGSCEGTDQHLAQQAANKIAQTNDTAAWHEWSGPVVTYYRPAYPLPSTEVIAAAVINVARAASEGMDISALVLHDQLIERTEDCRPTVFGEDDGWDYLRGNMTSRGYGESFIATYREQFDRLVTEGAVDTDERYEPYLSSYWEDQTAWKLFDKPCPTGALKEEGAASAQQFVLRKRYVDEAAKYGLTIENIVNFVSVTGANAEKMNAITYTKSNRATTRIACTDAKPSTTLAENVVEACAALLSHVDASVKGKGLADGLVPLSIASAVFNPALRADVARECRVYQARREGQRWLDDCVLRALRQLAVSAGAQVVYAAAHDDVAGDLFLDYIASGAVLGLNKATGCYDASQCLSSRHLNDAREGEDVEAANLGVTDYGSSRVMRSLFGELVRLKPELATEALVALLARPGIVGGSSNDWRTPYGFQRGWADPNGPSIDAGEVGRLMRKRKLKMTKNRLKSLVRFTAYLSNLEAFNPYLLKFLLGTEKHGKKAAQEWQAKAKNELHEREQAALDNKPAMCAEEIDWPQAEYITVTTGAYDAQ